MIKFQSISRWSSYVEKYTKNGSLRKTLLQLAKKLPELAAN